MKNICCLLTLGLLLGGGISLQAEESADDQTVLEIKDAWYYINGEKTFINALGYEIGARPGQHPKEPRVLELTRMVNDLQLIKEAGFNAIRIWADLSEEEVKVVQASGLYLIFGIEINQYADFSDPEFIEETVYMVDSIVSYTRNYDCIISYLIMNEPMPQHIYDVGAQATYDLWMTIKTLIHEKHPGIPVSISGNSAITEFLDMNMFDLYSYNAYDYGEGINYTHGYANANRFLSEMNGDKKPLVLTEFGKSVSRLGWGEYGGNTLTEQMNALPEYYRNILDAGASGACAFYYADGWWKGSRPEVHDDTPEEWFGYWGYSDLEDTIGYPRPVWYALKEYNKALIASPKNQCFYQNEVPIDIHPQKEVSSLRVIYHDKLIYESNEFSGCHFADTLYFRDEALTDRELVFEFYDPEGNLLKYEIITILTGAEEITWPSLTVDIKQDDLNEADSLNTTFRVSKDTLFTFESELKYVFQPHLNWQPGSSEQVDLDPSLTKQSHKVSFKIPNESIVVGAYAGIVIRYGKFRKIIYDQELIYRGDWADPLRIK
jgi:hypothetical protein